MALRILNISDIHFKDEYADDDIIMAFRDSLKKKVTELNREIPFGLVILNGDIAYSGKGMEYKKFLDFINEVVPKRIPILSIPGNHDVNWDMLKVALDEKDLPSLFDKKDHEIEADLNGKYSKFKNIFTNLHTDFIYDLEKARPLKTDNLVSDYCTKRYCGYTYFKNEKVLILLINSAWYSFGKGVLEGMFEKKAREKEKESLINFCKEFVDGKLSQEGKQTYFFSYFPFHVPVNKILDDEDVKVITVAHHPPSWLRWEEQFNMSSGNTRNLENLLGKSHLLLTGHLHAPVTEPVALGGQCYHLSNGAFMEYSFIDKQRELKMKHPAEYFPSNWFTVIDVGQKKFKYAGYRFNAKLKDRVDDEYIYTWDLADPFSKKEFSFLKKNRPGLASVTVSMVDGAGVEMEINRYLPEDTGELSSIVKENRSNNLKFADTKIELADNKLHKCTFNSVTPAEYYVCVNAVKAVHEAFNRTSTFEELMEKSSLLKSMYDVLQSAKGEVPVFAFYEFFKASEEMDFRKKSDIELYQVKENEFFLYFQAFKHNFFLLYPQLYNFKELNIVFDCFVL